ncbi:helix-turn-helix domain-containing protein [Nocardia brasiliensis]|uniref:helix-turn-helix domain-containing protein n=1 Tax=Nocardia brasiliensis TaxID=37326 RepID=UPI0024539C08|nr:helix-turn-helix transcriptional regulator [Nocardia brasiliensis]
MTTHRRWRDTGHLERAVETAGGPEEFEAGVEHLRDQARGWRLAELRKHRGLSQKQVAEQMRVSVARVSQIEKGEVATREVLDRYVSALGGVLKLVAQYRGPRRRGGRGLNWRPG